MLQPQLLDNEIGIAHVGADRTAKPVAIDACEMDAGVGQRFAGGLSAQRDILQLAGEIALDLNRRTKQHAIGNSRHAGQSSHTAIAALNRLPNGLAALANRRDQADAGYHDAVVTRET